MIKYSSISVHELNLLRFWGRWSQLCLSGENGCGCVCHLMCSLWMKAKFYQTLLCESQIICKQRCPWTEGLLVEYTLANTTLPTETSSTLGIWDRKEPRSVPTPEAHREEGGALLYTKLSWLINQHLRFLLPNVQLPLLLMDMWACPLLRSTHIILCPPYLPGMNHKNCSFFLSDIFCALTKGCPQILSSLSQPFGSQLRAK